MTLKSRFGLIALGMILFAAITPVLVLYARGFKVDWKNHQLVKTGALVVRTEPAHAEVLLNDVRQNNLTPSDIRFLLPGDYTVRIIKDGYQAWTKRLNVRAQLVTWANHNREFITLFLKQARLEQTWEADSVSLSAKQDEIVFSSHDQVRIINVHNGNLGESDHVASQSVFAETDVLTFVRDGNEVWYIQDHSLKRFNTAAKTTEIISSDIPAATGGEIIRSDNQVYMILDQNLYILNDTLEKIYDKVTKAVWNESAKQLLFANDNEILLYDPSRKNTDLILRSSALLSHQMLNPETGYVFFESHGQIQAIELDGRDHRNLFDITASLGEFALSEDGTTLYTFSNSEIKQYTIR